MSTDKHYHSRVSMALDDLTRCRAYAQQMLKLRIGESFSDERTVYEALFVSLIVSYGRVFTTSNTTEQEYKQAVSTSFGEFRARVKLNFTTNEQSMHDQIVHKRHTAIAHSDASSRNYQHFNDSPLGFGNNPFLPFEHCEVVSILKLVDKLINYLAIEQDEVADKAFTNRLL